MPKNLDILRGISRAGRERPVDQGPVDDFEPVEAEDYLLGRYLTASVPEFLQPRLRELHEAANGTRAMQSLLLTGRLHASASGDVRRQIETLAQNDQVASSDLAQAAARAWYAQVAPEQRQAVHRRFMADLERLGQQLPAPPDSPGFLSGLGQWWRSLWNWGRVD